MGALLDELRTLAAVTFAMLGAALRWPLNLVLDLLGV